MRRVSATKAAVSNVYVVSAFRRTIKGAKQYSGYYYSKAFGSRLWQRYGFERVLRNDEATLVVARYTLENPLRAGLVTRIEDYRFVGSKTHPLEEILCAVVDAASHGPAEAGHYVP
jgi:hypothetical protein